VVEDKTSSVATSSAAGAVLCASSSIPVSSPLTVLGTVLAHARDQYGTWQIVRALVDSASQISAITASCSARLPLMVCQPHRSLMSVVSQHV
jgi:hypothetical protein